VTSSSLIREGRRLSAECVYSMYGLVYDHNTHRPRSPGNNIMTLMNAQISRRRDIRKLSMRARDSGSHAKMHASAGRSRRAIAD